MKKVLLIVLITLCLFGCGKDKEAEKIAKTPELKVVKEYNGDINVDWKTKEIYLDSEDEESSLVIGKDGVLYDKPKVNEDESYEDETPKKTYTIGNYTIKVKGNKLGVEYNNKVIVNYTIDYLKSGYESETFKDKVEISNSMVELIGDNLILKNTSYYYDYLFKDAKWKKAKTYLIDKNGIVKKYDGYLYTLTDYSGSEDEVYFFNYDSIYDKITIYDSSFEEIYHYVIINDDELDYQSNACNDIPTKVCKFDNIYYDMVNKKQVSEKEARYVAIDDIRGYTLINNKLTIYDKDTVIAEFSDVDSYLGGLLFLKISIDSEKSTIYKLVIN